jgi:hypothetical protein
LWGVCAYVDAFCCRDVSPFVGVIPLVMSGAWRYLTWVLATIDVRLSLASCVAMLLSVLECAGDEWEQSLSTAKGR